jgi:signal transduction histidine kinase
VQTETVQLESYLHDIVESLGESLENCPHRVEITTDPDKTELDLEPVSLAEVVKNLVLNATTHAYRDNGHHEGVITLSVESAPQCTHIVVRDDGCGISATNLPRIFEPFFTTSSEMAQPGLGLNIAHNLVTQRLGGTIECHSEVGKGTEFVISIPS